MSQKIFISYRRQDTAANALGIGQYLEHEFGRKNVFIDVDMRAGVKFPTVLEQRLAECKVMLVLIGPDWLNSRDKQGHLRLESPDDWVRLEIAHALRRNITVIPVRINGAELPASAALTDDIRGLLDHQAVSISNAGFRHEMAGLVKDIRAIPSPRSWRRFGSVAAGLLVLIGALITVGVFGLSNSLEHIRNFSFLRASNSANENAVWKGSPGEWVMFAFDQKPVAYYFRPSSVKATGDQVEYTARWPIKSVTTTAPLDNALPQAAYDEDRTIMDCKKSVTVLLEKTVYSVTGGSLSHFKRPDTASVDWSVGEAIKPNTIISSAEHLLCDDQLRTPLTNPSTNGSLSYLSLTANGEGDVYYGPPKPISDDPPYETERLFVVKFNTDQHFADMFPGQTILGLPLSYRSMTQATGIDCGHRRLLSRKLEYADQAGNLLYVAVPVTLQPLDVKEGSIFDALLDVTCGRDVSGVYEGINTETYTTGDAQGDQQISITIEQNGSDLNVSFKTPTGGQGKGVGTLKGGAVDSMQIQSTAPECAGSFQASFKFNDDHTVSWSFKGHDCGGPMEGRGTAKKTKA